VGVHDDVVGPPLELAHTVPPLCGLPTPPLPSLEQSAGSGYSQFRVMEPAAGQLVPGPVPRSAGRPRYTAQLCRTVATGLVLGKSGPSAHGHSPRSPAGLNQMPDGRRISHADRDPLRWHRDTRLPAHA